MGVISRRIVFAQVIGNRMKKDGITRSTLMISIGTRIKPLVVVACHVKNVSMVGTT